MSVVIGDRPLTSLVPLFKDESSSLPATQFNMKYVELAGLVKFDFLGLKTLSIIEHACKIVRETAEHQLPNFVIQSIPLDDPLAVNNVMSCPLSYKEFIC